MYKTDKQIEEEFKDFKVLDISIKYTKENEYLSGSINIDFPNGDESVGGGAKEVCDSFMFYNYTEWKDGLALPKIAFDNWYPDDTNMFLVASILQKIETLKK